MLVRTRMTEGVVTASPEMTLAEALALTRQHRIRHLPVMEGGKLIGLVTDRDLRLAMPPIWADERDELREQLTRRRVGELMITELITATPDTPVEDAARQLYQNRIGCLPIMEGEELVGILTETDLLRALVELFGTEQPSSRVEIRMPNRPGELARVVRIIGIEHKVNITGLVIPPVGDAEEDAIAIVHLQTLEPEPVLEALFKLGYRIGSPSVDSGEYLGEEPRTFGNRNRSAMKL